MRVAAVAAALLVVLTESSIAMRAQAPRSKASETGQRAPEFSIASMTGETISLETLRGHVVLLDFWASWCRPCVQALPSLHQLLQDHARDPFVVVGISSDRQESVWRRFVDRHAMVWPQYYDDEGRMQRLFGVRGIPTYVLLDGDGIVRASTVDADRLHVPAR